MRRKIIFIAVFLLIITTLGACKKEDSGSVPDRIETVTLNDESFTSDDIAENTLTVLNVWATWCPPCIAELPELEAVNEAYRDKGVEVVGVLQDGITELGVEDEKTIETAKTLLEYTGANYRVVLPDEMLQTTFIHSMQAFPTTFFLSSDGEVVRTEVGAKDFEKWSAVIDEVLEEMGY